MRDRVVALLGALGLIALIIGSITVWTSAPCGLWSLSKAGDIPARCIKH